MGGADEALVGAVLRPPELEGPGPDPLPGLGLARVHRRLPELVAAAAGRVEDRGGGAGRGPRPLAVALEDLPAVRGLARQPGGERDRDRDHDHRRGRDQRLAAARPQPARAPQVARREPDPDLRRGDGGADRQRDPHRLVPLRFRGRGRQPAGERLAAVHGEGEQRRAAGPGAQREQLRQAVRREGEEGDHRRDGDDRARPRGGQVERQAGERDRRRGERLQGDRPRRGGRRQQQRQRHRGQRPDPARVAQRVGEAALDLDPRQHLAQLVDREPGHLQAGEDAERRDQAEAEGDPVQHLPRPRPPPRRQAGAEREDAEVGRDSGQLPGGPLGALRPAQRDRGPGAEAGQQAERGEAGAGPPRQRQRLHRHPQQHRPPDRDPDLVARNRVVAAVFQRQVDDEEGGQQPGRRPAPVERRHRRPAIGRRRPLLYVLRCFQCQGPAQTTTLGRYPGASNRNRRESMQGTLTQLAFRRSRGWRAAMPPAARRRGAARCRGRAPRRVRSAPRPHSGHYMTTEWTIYAHNNR